MSTPPNVPSGSNLYSQGFGSTSSNSINSAIKATRAPATSDVRGPSGNYPIGQMWVDTSTPAAYILGSFSASSGTLTANWVLAAVGTGDLETLSGDTGTAIPSSGNIQIAGGTNIATSASGSTVTVDLDGTIPVANGGTGTSTAFTAGSVVFAGAAGVYSQDNANFFWDNTNDRLGIGTATPGFPLEVSKDLGNNEVSITISNKNNGAALGKSIAVNFQGTDTVGTTKLVSLISAAPVDVNWVDSNLNFANRVGDVVTLAGFFSGAGNFAASGSVTATLGAITATNGNLVLGTAGNKLSIATGANASVGTATLVGGTITVNTTAVTASSIIHLTRQSIGATGAAALGVLTVGTVVAGTSFVINAVQAADATALQASDVSVIGWTIIN